MSDLCAFVSKKVFCEKIEKLFCHKDVCKDIIRAILEREEINNHKCRKEFG